MSESDKKVFNLTKYILICLEILKDLVVITYGLTKELLLTFFKVITWFCVVVFCITSVYLLFEHFNLLDILKLKLYEYNLIK